jgi:protease-4
LNHVLQSIKQAASDKQIKGIYIKTGASGNGWAHLQALRQALIDFKKSNKFILAYGEMADQKSNYVASVSDGFYLNPSGMFEFKGLSISGTFYKKALDKLGVTSEAFHCGKYKGAYEPFKLEKYSEPNRYQLGVLLQDFYTEYLQAQAMKTGLDTAQLHQMAVQGTVRFPQDAAKYKFVDGLVYADSVESMLRSKIGIKKDEKISFVSPADYAESITPSVKIKDKIAILYASGEIHDGSGNDGIYSKTMTKTIRKIADDESIKAVVLRINSPGGSALASEVMYHELMQLKAKKPIVVSMSNYAASGGYYIACAADSIFAETTTLTGSIGVVGVLFNVESMMRDKLGVTFDEVKTGPYGDFPNMTRTMTDAERQWIQSYLDTTYNLFKSRVATARKMSMEEVEELAQGHVYSGKLAKQIGLVDENGDINRAIKSAAKLASLKEYRNVEYPKPVDPFEEIMRSFSGKDREEAILKKVLGEDYHIYSAIQKAKNRQNQIQTILPMQLDIR